MAHPHSWLLKSGLQEVLISYLVMMHCGESSNRMDFRHINRQMKNWKTQHTMHLLTPMMLHWISHRTCRPFILCFQHEGVHSDILTCKISYALYITWWIQHKLLKHWIHSHFPISRFNWWGNGGSDALCNAVMFTFKS
jgi:hypothetical protein